MKQLFTTFLLCLLLSACASPDYAGSSKCMQQADTAYEVEAHTVEQLKNECKAMQVNAKNKKIENHGIVDRSILEFLTSFLNGVFN
ncbi:MULTISPECIES: hypothetical protein [unclassified Pseudoalteromonas]|uniref:hypothetical protein n=1 Tax=unclassified Pseudoalteromonas TaxID=194690 RepID=UPI00041F3EEA|nr:MULTISPECIES: hypothetical protein [unclassified Pseudoalteromonas]